MLLSAVAAGPQDGRINDAEARAGRMAERIRAVAEVKQAASLASVGASTVSIASADLSSIADYLRDAVGRLGTAAKQTD